jgi:F0F1-type ATP synthase membrane subunit c/vacuolar-type H+-ATPase subunit K
MVGGGCYFEAVAHGYVAGAHVDEKTRDEERVDFVIVLNDG